MFNFIEHPDSTFIINNISLNAYPNSELSLKLIDKLKQVLYCESFEVLITHGSDDALKLIVDTFVNNETKILLPVPTYNHMKHFLQAASKNINYVYIENNIQLLELLETANEILYI